MHRIQDPGTPRGVSPFWEREIFWASKSAQQWPQLAPQAVAGFSLLGELLQGVIYGPPPRGFPHFLKKNRRQRGVDLWDLTEKLGKRGVPHFGIFGGVGL